MHQTWQQWEHHTRDLRSRGRLAAQELSLRGIDPVDVSPSDGLGALAPDMSAAQLAEQYAIQSAAADWFRTQLEQRWAPAYLAHRGLTQPAAEALAGYAPSRPGQWTLLLDHLRNLGHDDTAIHTAGLATQSRRGQLIDRFRDRIMFPILDVHDRPIGFIGRKPAGDTNPDNPKYLNPPRTPLYDKSRVLLGLDRHAVRRLHDGARPIIVEGAMDRLAIRAAADDLVPLAPSGVALTAAHLDLIAEHTSLDRIILAFDPDPAGQAATLKAGRMLIDRGVPPSSVEIFTGPPGADPADRLATQGAAALADALQDPQHRETLLDLLVDQKLDHYDTDTRPLRDLPISEHAATHAAKLVADTFRNQTTDPAAVTAHIHRHISRIITRTGIDPGQLNQYLLDTLIRHDDLEFELPGTTCASTNPSPHCTTSNMRTTSRRHLITTPGSPNASARGEPAVRALVIQSSPAIPRAGTEMTYRVSARLLPRFRGPDPRVAEVRRRARQPRGHEHLDGDVPLHLGNEGLPAAADDLADRGVEVHPTRDQKAPHRLRVTGDRVHRVHVERATSCRARLEHAGRGSEVRGGAQHIVSGLLRERRRDMGRRHRRVGRITPWSGHAAQSHLCGASGPRGQAQHRRSSRSSDPIWIVPGFSADVENRWSPYFPGILAMVTVGRRELFSVLLCTVCVPAKIIYPLRSLSHPECFIPGRRPLVMQEGLAVFGAEIAQRHHAQ
jgi:DNA primase catalytic core